MEIPVYCVTAYYSILLLFFIGIPCALAIPSDTAENTDDESTFDTILKVNTDASEKLFEGDIEPTWFEKQISGTALVARDAIRDRSHLWRTKVIPYEISSLFSSKDNDTIKAALKVFEEKTCLKFKLRSDESNWIRFERHDGCFSVVGKQYTQTGSQRISLGEGCMSRKTILHEVMHALGFWHEQSRPDRHKYVEIFWENIKQSEESNFNQYTHMEADTLGVDYDYDSIMHYSRNAFSKNGKPTILAINNKDRLLGQSQTLSPSDVIQINALYDCRSNSNEIWSSWTNYSPCDSFCMKKRQRFCSHVDVAKCPNANKHGIAEEKIKCTDAECHTPVDGHWSRWSSWSECIPDCGPRRRYRKRYCNNPAPKYGGKTCEGSSEMVSKCSTRKCEISCDFEEELWCSWKDDPGNSYRMKWKRQNFATPSKGTGPDKDHTTGKGYFVFTETSNPARKGDRAKLISKMLTPTKGKCLSFWYHMYGKAMGSLRIKIKQAKGIEKEIWKLTGNQGNKWIQGNKTIVSEESYQIIFEAERGDDYTGDVALDDIKFTEGKCEKDFGTTFCGANIKPIGCFQDSRNDRIFPVLLDSHRDGSFHHNKFMINWMKYKNSLETLLCHCTERAKAKGYKYFGIQYYGECWSGPGEPDFTKHGSSDFCFNSNFKQCSIDRDFACTGGENVNFVYRLE